MLIKFIVKNLLNITLYIPLFFSILSVIGLFMKSTGDGLTKYQITLILLVSLFVIAVNMLITLKLEKNGYWDTDETIKS